MFLSHRTNIERERNAMAADGFEEWDQDFLQKLFQFEQALPSTNPTQHHAPPPLPPRRPPEITAPPYDHVSYSPPRELSQRVKDNGTIKGFDHSLNSSVPYLHRSHNVKEDEIDRLKRELAHVSKQLANREHECLELRRERDRKEEQLSSVASHVEAKGVEVICTKSKNLGNEGPIQDRISIGCQNVNASSDVVGSRIDVGTTDCKTIGVQTDEAGEECTRITTTNDSSTRHCSNKLRAIWDPPNDLSSGRNLVSKILVACETDFHVLFGCLRLNKPAHSAEAAKVTHLYSMLTKFSNGMVKLEDVLEALTDLCRLENVVIIYRSLRVLHMVLNYSFCLERKTDRRNNVVVEEPSLHHATNIHGPESGRFRNLFSANANDASDSGDSQCETRSLNLENLRQNELWNHAPTESIARVDWVSLFELMHQITAKSNEEHVILEAVSIMNLILMRSNAYLERERFGRMLSFQSVSKLLRKEAGIRVQMQAVHLLYLLLNCPEFMVGFCSGCKEDAESAGTTHSDASTASAIQGYSAILEGLADCVACSGNNIQELKLRRNAIIVLAFLASSGRSGFEILLGHRLPKSANFIGLTLRVLVSEMDKEESESAQAPEIFKERCLLIREVLILLNRLVSNPQHSAPVLRVLTNSRDVASLTIDIANRLSRKSKWFLQSDSTTRQMRESEIVDLARVFKKRVFTFLGDRIA